MINEFLLKIVQRIKQNDLMIHPKRHLFDN